jgi:hypothetical protein
MDWCVTGPGSPKPVSVLGCRRLCACRGATAEDAIAEAIAEHLTGESPTAESFLESSLERPSAEGTRTACRESLLLGSDIADFVELLEHGLGTLLGHARWQGEVVMVALAAVAIHAVGGVLVLCGLGVVQDLCFDLCHDFGKGGDAFDPQQVVDVGLEGGFEAGCLHLVVEGVLDVADAGAREQGGVEVVADMVGESVVGLGSGHGDGLVVGHGG